MISGVISKYLEHKKLTWSLGTFKTESSRLRSLEVLLRHLNILTPQAIWEALQARSFYTRVIDWERLQDLFSTYNVELSQSMRSWKEKNKHVFKNAYKRKTPQISYEEALKLINKIDDEHIRNQARIILFAGLRSFELNSLDRDGNVLGKGGKKRQVPLPDSFELPKASYKKLYLALKRVGLKPHDLRKIRATDLLRKGMDVKTLQTNFGWSSLKVAESYLAPLSLEQSRRFYDK